MYHLQELFILFNSNSKLRPVVESLCAKKKAVMDFPRKGQELHAWTKSRNIKIKKLVEPVLLHYIRFRRGHVNAALLIGFLIL